jgi:hypothetical protein
VGEFWPKSPSKEKGEKLAGDIQVSHCANQGFFIFLAAYRTRLTG